MSLDTEGKISRDRAEILRSSNLGILAPNLPGWSISLIFLTCYLRNVTEAKV